MDEINYQYSQDEQGTSGEQYHLLYVDGWDKEAGEALGGGRCVGSYAGTGAVLAAHDSLAGGAARLLWGAGHLVVTNDQGELRFAPTLESAALAVA